MKQEWKKYTEEDHAVWKILFERQLQNLQGKAWDEYLNSISLAGLTAEEVPDFYQVELALSKQTGWEIEVVPGIISVDEFLRLLARKRFCSSTWLRSRAQLDYLEEPDMFHDIFGHIPLLINKSYSDFVVAFARLGLHYLHHPQAVMLLERLYWFTIEFGMMRSNGKLQIYGAGILSSFGESKHVFGKDILLRPFTAEAVLLTPFRNNEIQKQYFVVEEINDLWNCLPEVKRLLDAFVVGELDEDVFCFQEQLGTV
jgi:phenylalanine-4-hydroxylase